MVIRYNAKSMVAFLTLSMMGLPLICSAAQNIANKAAAKNPHSEKKSAVNNKQSLQASARVGYDSNVNTVPKGSAFDTASFARAYKRAKDMAQLHRDAGLSVTPQLAAAFLDRELNILQQSSGTTGRSHRKKIESTTGEKCDGKKV